MVSFVNVSAVVRDLVPGDWYVPPLAVGHHIASLTSPDLAVSWRLYQPGNWPAPARFRLFGEWQDPMPIELELHQLALGPAPTCFEVSCVDGAPRKLVARHELPSDSVKVIEWMVAQAGAWEAKFRPGRTWVCRKDRASALDAERLKAIERAEKAMLAPQQAMLANETPSAPPSEVKAEPKKVGWVIRRGHRVQVEI